VAWHLASLPYRTACLEPPPRLHQALVLVDLRTSLSYCWVQGRKKGLRCDDWKNWSLKPCRAFTAPGVHMSARLLGTSTHTYFCDRSLRRQATRAELSVNAMLRSIWHLHDKSWLGTTFRPKVSNGISMLQNTGTKQGTFSIPAGNAHLRQKSSLRSWKSVQHHPVSNGIPRLWPTNGAHR